MSTITAISPRSSIRRIVRSNMKCRGTCLRTSRKPITPSCSSRWISWTPCSASRRPPTAARSSSGRMRRSAAATPAAWRSPEASPATNSTLRMVQRMPYERGKSSLDFLDDAKGDAERHPSLVPGNDDGSLSPERRDKTLELELQRLAVRRVELDAGDEREDVRGGRTDRERGDGRAKPEEISRTGCEVEREIPNLLQEPDLSFSFPRDPARGLQQRVGLFERRRDRLLDEDVLPTLDCCTRDREVLRCRHDDDHRIRDFQQSIERGMRLDLQLFLHFPTALCPRLHESGERQARKVAQNSYVVEPEAARADDPNAWSIRQITTPRSLASTNRMSS